MTKKTLIVLILILILAGFFRFWKLGEIPPGLYPDEAINGNEAILDPGKVFYPENNGREGLFINILNLSFLFCGKSIWTMRAVSAFFGTLTVLGLYLLVKELFIQTTNDKRQATSIALLASFFLAISFWHTNFSRIVFRAILLPFVLVFSFYFLLKGFRVKKIWNFIVAGIFFGLGFHTYISFRFAVLILPAVLIPYWFIYKNQNLKKKFLLPTGYFLLVTILVALPIGIHFLKNPKDLVGRAAPITIFKQENPFKAFLTSLFSHLGMFNLYGDPNWRHNLSTSPMLLWPLGILFLIGILLLIKELISSIKNKKLLPIASYSLLIAWFLAMILPGVLTFEGIPHSLRVIGVIPVVYIFIALAAEKIYQFLAVNTKTKPLLVFACLFLLFAISFSEFNKYFVKWGKNPEVEGAFTKKYVEIGNYLNSLSEETKKYVIVNELGSPLYGISIPAQTVIFIENTKFDQPRAIYLRAEDLNQIKIAQGKTVIVPLYNGRLSEALHEKFPEIELEERKYFNIYKIDKE